MYSQSYRKSSEGERRLGLCWEMNGKITFSTYKSLIKDTRHRNIPMFSQQSTLEMSHLQTFLIWLSSSASGDEDLPEEEDFGDVQFQTIVSSG